MVTRDELLALLEPIGFNEANLRLLVEQLRTPLSVGPYVVAGSSIPLGFPGWKGFLLSPAEGAGIEPGVRQRIEAQQYEEAAGDLVKALDKSAMAASFW